MLDILRDFLASKGIVTLLFRGRTNGNEGMSPQKRQRVLQDFEKSDSKRVLLTTYQAASKRHRPDRRQSRLRALLLLSFAWSLTGPDLMSVASFG